MHLSHQYNAAYFSGLVQNRCTYHTNTTPLTFLAWYKIDAPITPIQRRFSGWVHSMHLSHQYNAAYFSTESMHLSHQYNAAYFSGLVQNRCTYHTNTTPLTFLAWYKIDESITPIQRRLLFCLGTESMHLTHQYNAAYFSGLVQNRWTYHTNTTPLTFLAWYTMHLTHQYNAAHFSGLVKNLNLSHHYNAAYFSGWVQNRCTYHTNTTPLTFLAWYRIDAPITPIQRRLLFWLGTESMHLSHQYNAAHFSRLVQNWWIYHTNTTPLTFLSWYRIDAPNTPIQRRLLFWLGTKSMNLSHQYNAAYFSGLVQNRCT